MVVTVPRRGLAGLAGSWGLDLALAAMQLAAAASWWFGYAANRSVVDVVVVLALVVGAAVFVRQGLLSRPGPREPGPGPVSPHPVRWSGGASSGGGRAPHPR